MPNTNNSGEFHTRAAKDHEAAARHHRSAADSLERQNINQAPTNKEPPVNP